MGSNSEMHLFHGHRGVRSLLRSRIYYAAWGNERPRAVEPPALTPMRRLVPGILVGPKYGLLVWAGNG